MWWTGNALRATILAMMGMPRSEIHWLEQAETEHIGIAGRLVIVVPFDSPQESSLRRLIVTIDRVAKPDLPAAMLMCFPPTPLLPQLSIRPAIEDTLKVLRTKLCATGLAVTGEGFGAAAQRGAATALFGFARLENLRVTSTVADALAWVCDKGRAQLGSSRHGSIDRSQGRRIAISRGRWIRLGGSFGLTARWSHVDSGPRTWQPSCMTTWSRPWVRMVGRLLLAGLLLVLLLIAVVVIDGWVSFGKAASDDRAERMQRSPHFRQGIFVNAQPLWNDLLGAFIFQAESSPVTEPTEPVPTVSTDPRLFGTPPASGLRVTWLGHSTTLIEIDGVRLLTDPIFGGRASPVSWAGPQAWYAPPLAFDDVPEVDAVLISHDHYDHLQAETIARMATWSTTFICPLGVGAHLEYWGIPPARIVELDWEQSHRVKTVEVVATPSRHASGRHVFDQNHTLWTSYAVKGPDHRVFLSGDTGLFPGMRDIGQRHGPFDVTMIEVGAYNRAWPDWHLGPEQALIAHRWLRGRLLMPIHWGLWNLAAHGWTEPVERLLRACADGETPLAIPKPGQSIEPSQLPTGPAQGAKLLTARWWPRLPFDTAEQHPVVATRVPGVSPVPDPRVDD